MGKKENAGLFLKGFIIGGTMTVPGVSGGTMAILLGIYDKLLRAINQLWKDGGKGFLFLFIALLGGGLGLLTCSGFTLELLTRYPIWCGFFFMGAIAGGMPLLIKSANIKRIKMGTFFYPLLGVGIVWGISKVPSDMLHINSGSGIIFIMLQILCGLVLAIALILPGISVSHMLLVLGLYEYVMESVSSFRFLSLIPLALGVLLGVLVFSKYLELAMEKEPQMTYLLILGFVAASIYELYPGKPGNGEWFFSFLFLMLGFLFTYCLSWKEGLEAK